MGKTLTNIILLFIVILLSSCGKIEISGTPTKIPGANIQPPNIDQKFLINNGWTQTNLFGDRPDITWRWTYRAPLGLKSGNIDVPTYRVDYTNTYEKSRIKEESLNSLNKDILIASILKIDTSNSLLTEEREQEFANDDKILNLAEDEITSAFRKFGINLRKIGDSTNFANKNIKFRRFNGKLDYPSMNFKIFDKYLTISEGSILIESRIYSWDCQETDKRYIFMITFPTENFNQVINKKLTEAIEITINLNLHLTQNNIENNINNFIESISC